MGEKPNVAWDRQDLERLYARLQNQYALNEQAEALSRKLSVIAETAEVLTDGDPRLDFRLGEVPKQPTAAATASNAREALYHWRGFVVFLSPTPVS